MFDLKFNMVDSVEWSGSEYDKQRSGPGHLGLVIVCPKLNMNCWDQCSLNATHETDLLRYYPFQHFIDDPIKICSCLMFNIN